MKYDDLKRLFIKAYGYDPKSANAIYGWSNKCPFEKQFRYIVKTKVDRFGNLYIGSENSGFRFVRITRDAKRFSHMEAWSLKTSNPKFQIIQIAVCGLLKNEKKEIVGMW